MITTNTIETVLEIYNKILYWFHLHYILRSRATFLFDSQPNKMKFMKYSFAFIWPIIKSKRFFTSQVKTLAIICSYRWLISKHHLDMKSSSEIFHNIHCAGKTYCLLMVCLSAALMFTLQWKSKSNLATAFSIISFVDKWQISQRLFHWANLYRITLLTMSFFLPQNTFTHFPIALFGVLTLGIWESPFREFHHLNNFSK